MSETNGRLELDIVDVHGFHLTEPADVLVRHHSLHEQRRAPSADASRTIVIDGLRTEPQGLHVLEIATRSYHRFRQFVTIPSTGIRHETAVLPIRADKARGLFPSYDALDERVKGVLERSTSVRGHEGLSGRALYDALREVPKAGLLNIAKKSLVTTFKNGGDLLPKITLLDAVGDRCFVEVPSALPDQMLDLVDDDLFKAVNGALHEAPPGFAPSGSYKTPDDFGNLQLTFFRSPGACRADVDIDDAGGLGHVFQVVRNTITGDPTHPFNIHQILMKHQHLDAGYRLVPNA